VLDERHASKSFAQKMYPVMHELSPRQRVAMRESSGDTNSDQLLAWAAFLRPSQYKVCTYACTALVTASRKLFTEFRPLYALHCSSSNIEAWFSWATSHTFIL
jgi:hypothetical protein